MGTMREPRGNIPPMLEQVKHWHDYAESLGLVGESPDQIMWDLIKDGCPEALAMDISRSVRSIHLPPPDPPDLLK